MIEVLPLTSSVGKTIGVPASASSTDWSKPLEKPIGALLLLVTAVFVTYAPSLNGQFLWDDSFLITNNLLIRSPLFCLEVFRHTLFGDQSNFYRPTQSLTFIADYWLGGLNPFIYHLTSLLIHAGDAFLLCLVLRLVLPTVLSGVVDKRGINLLALGVSLVWAVHPVHSAAVAYVSGTADTLAMLFCLSAVLLCEQVLRCPRPLPRLAWTAGAFSGLLAGLCAKEIAATWLLLFLGYLFALRRNTSPRARWTVVAVAAVALAIYIGLRHLPTASPIQSPAPPMPARGVLMLRALGDYGSLLLFPDKLFMERQVFAAPGLANAPDEFFYGTLTFSGLLMLAMFIFGCVWPGRGQRLRQVGVAWFMAGFLPISNLFALNASVAEHWLYLPSIGFLLFVVGVGVDLPWWHRRGATSTLLLVVGVAVVTLGIRTWYRTFDWADEMTFFRQTIADGGDVPRARAGLAAAYSHQALNRNKAGVNEQALDNIRDTVRRFPKLNGPRINLANLLARQGDLTQARTILEAVAANLFSAQHEDLHELITVLRGLDILDKDDPLWPEHRRAMLNRGFQRHPDSWELADYSARNQERQGCPEAALTLARHYADAHWWHAPSHLMVGQLEAELDRTDAALAAWTAASRLDVHGTEAFDLAATLCLQKGRLDKAHDYQSQAVRRQPDSPRQHLLLAQILERQSHSAAAQAEVVLANTLVQANENDESAD